jgi:hypothetical protein
VHQPGVVRGIQRRRHRGDERRRTPRPQGALPAHHHPQVISRDETHRDEQHALGLAGLVDGDDVRVVDRRDRPCLTHEPLADHLVAGQQLQGHHPAQPLVTRAVHRRHPAHADQLLQPVPGHPGTSRKPGQRTTRLRGGFSGHHPSSRAAITLIPV